VRAPAKAAGVVVGRVERIKFDPTTYQAVVTIKIDHAYQFSTDTIASILTSGLLGEVYIGLDSGGDTKMLPDGGRIAKTQSALVLEKLIGQFLFDKAASSGDKAASSATRPRRAATRPRRAAESEHSMIKQRALAHAAAVGLAASLVAGCAATPSPHRSARADEPRVLRGARRGRQPR
jgi:hypothetical protein